MSAKPYPIPPLPSNKPAFGPPAKFKKQREAKAQELASDAPLQEDTPKLVPKRDPSYPERMRLRKVPEPAGLDFPLPQPSILAGTVRSRIEALVKSIKRAEFLCQVRSTNFFEIRAHYRIGEETEHIHFGEIYEHFYQDHPAPEKIVSTPHAWIILANSGVWQFMVIHSECDSMKLPTWLFSVENYLMFMHLRVDMPLPQSIFDSDADLRGWVGKIYRD